MTIQFRMALFWRNLIYGDKLKVVCSLKQNGVHIYKLLNCIESIFNDAAMGYVFPIQDDTDNKLLFKPSVLKNI